MSDDVVDQLCFFIIIKLTIFLFFFCSYYIKTLLYVKITFIADFLRFYTKIV
jgi:hypothetical protein